MNNNLQYTSTISLTLAEKLKEKGMPEIKIEWNPIHEKYHCFNTYAEVIDWLLSEKNIFTDVHPTWETGKVTYKSATLTDDMNKEYYSFSADTWHEAANAAIEKALELI